jgi:hypothetical protein
VLGRTRFERSDPRSLLLDHREQPDDHLAHDQRGLFPMGGIQRKTCGKSKSGRHRIPLMPSS